ncbi:hypothetical protein PR003_g16475 [Phytophthora rubi]|uniref:CCHC-type domain-containing protein n=1 Tax=Phytophthora rubi TaxID=129364 RepID=A0A6A3L3P0_9STRA|nr:hypothetical protein PR002_g15559 [Phytophthora rubi]KAE9010414.1 hypothetical protein PR001_g16179 [Phytophthora rubi]KAE9325460.1 hypothetical protein PR003_g16475 [Phytophthora rubi]
MLKVEGQRSQWAPLGLRGEASRYGPQPRQARQPLRSREERLVNHQQYQVGRSSQQAAPTAGTGDRVCYYCWNTGHFARECRLKASDFAAQDTSPDQCDEVSVEQSTEVGNAQRA